MPDERKNIKVDPETFDRLRFDKSDDESWDDYLLDLYEGVPKEGREVQIPESQIQEIARATVKKLKSIR